MVLTRLREFLAPKRLSANATSNNIIDITPASSPTVCRSSPSQSPDSVIVTVYDRSSFGSRHGGHSGLNSNIATTSTPSKSSESEGLKRSHRHHLKLRRHSKDSNHSLSAATKRIVAVFQGVNKPRNRDSAITIATEELSIREEDEDSLPEASSPRLSIPNHLKSAVTSMPLLTEIAMASSSPLRESLETDTMMTNSSPSGITKTRIIQPKIAALVEKFEEEVQSGVTNKENKPLDSSKVTDACIFEDVSTNVEAFDSSSADILKPLISSSNGALRRFASVHSLSPSYSNGSTTGTSVTIKPKLRVDVELAPSEKTQMLKQSSSASPLKLTTNIIRSMPSIVELVPFRRRDSHRESNGKNLRVSVTRPRCIDEEQVRGWESKMNVVSVWIDKCLKTGRVEEFPSELLEDLTHGGERNSDDTEKTLTGEAEGILSAEQDLMECLKSSDCQLYVIGYSIHLLQEALDIQMKKNTERIPWAQEAALFLIDCPDRLPLGVRIQAIHLLVELNCFESKQEGLLIMAWELCHQLLATKFMTDWKTKTLSLWAERIGELARLPDLEVKPPVEGYDGRALMITV